MAQFTKYVGTITGQTGSLITALDAALVTGQSWTTPFTGTNKKVYRPPTGGNRFYLRVDDNATGTGGAKEALIRAGEVMTDADTFSVNPFPSNAQSGLTANSLVLRKSVTADSTTRSYKLYADDRTFILFIQSEASTFYVGPTYFGDFYSLVASDAYRTCICGKIAENSVSVTSDALGTASLNASLSTYAATGGFFMARNYLGTGGSATVMRMSDPKFQSTQSVQGYLTVPNGPNGGVYLSRQHIIEQTSSIIQYRGRLRGMWSWCHQTLTYADSDTFSGTAELAGKTYEFIGPIGSAAGNGAWCIETSATLETN